MPPPLLADIGNTHFHLYDGTQVIHLPHDEAIERYRHQTLSYISVNSKLTPKLATFENWDNIAPIIHLKGAYETMGIDRQALCLSREDGVFVDAGSAITVDVVEGGVYRGGFILEGIRARLECYGAISEALKTTLSPTINLTHLPTTTKDGISYGIISSIISAIEPHTRGRQLYCTGGDGQLLSTYFEDAFLSDTLVFEGMSHALKGHLC